MIAQFQLEGGTVLTPTITGLRLLISVTDQTLAVGFKDRPRLIVYSGRDQSTVTTDLPIQVVRGPAITGKDWDELVRYIGRNRPLLIGLWTGEIGRSDYMHRQSPVD
jgi:hypothetical protein